MTEKLRFRMNMKWIVLLSGCLLAGCGGTPQPLTYRVHLVSDLRIPN